LLDDFKMVHICSSARRLDTPPFSPVKNPGSSLKEVFDEKDKCSL
jgi:hypothetical protein